MRLRPALTFGVVLDENDTAYISRSWPGHGGHGFILAYPAGPTSDTVPERVIRGFDVGLNGLAREVSGLLYRGNGDGGFDVIDPRAPGERPPIRRLTGPDSELFGAGSFAIDSGGRLYVPNQDDAIRVYDGWSTGDLRPIRTIAGRRSGLDQPVAVALGPGDTLYVANAGTARGPSVTVYAPQADGDAAPVRAIRGARAGLTSLSALAVDAVGRLYVVSNPAGTQDCWPAGW
jgi:hypothetical protein